MKDCCQTGGSNPQLSANRVEAHPAELAGPTHSAGFDCWLVKKNSNTYNNSLTHMKCAAWLGLMLKESL